MEDRSVFLAPEMAPADVPVDRFAGNLGRPGQGRDGDSWDKESHLLPLLFLDPRKEVKNFAVRKPSSRLRISRPNPSVVFDHGTAAGIPLPDQINSREGVRRLPRYQIQHFFLRRLNFAHVLLLSGLRPGC